MPDNSNEQTETRIPLPRWAYKVLDTAHCPFCNQTFHRADASAVGMRWVQGYGLLFFFECECPCGKQSMSVVQGRPMNATSLAKAMRQAAVAAGETGCAVLRHLKPISEDELRAARVSLALMESNEEFLSATGMTPEEIERFSKAIPEKENPDSE